MGVHGWGRMRSYQELYAIEIHPTYRWFPWVWFDLVKFKYVVGLVTPMEREMLKHRVSKKEAIAFKKLLE